MRGDYMSIEEVEDAICSGLFDEIPLKGNVIVVIGDSERCEPCKNLEKFLESNKDIIDAMIIKMDVRSFSICKPNARNISMPTILFVKDANVKDTTSGFGSGEVFLDRIRKAFGKKSVK
jgi:hypothetical protein